MKKEEWAVERDAVELVVKTLLWPVELIRHLVSSSNDRTMRMHAVR